MPCEPNAYRFTSAAQTASVRTWNPAQFCLKVEPLQGAGPICSPQVLVATITDPCGVPVAGERVEWIIESTGVGQIVTVDQHGVFPRRGGKLTSTCAVSFTSDRECVLNRAAAGTSNDTYIRPGQTCCVITSTVEGETAVTVRAPGISDGERNRVIVTRHWIDATWELPAPSTGRAGTEQSLRTRVRRISTGQPLANYTVRYRVVNGPPTNFTPGGGPEIDVQTDSSGVACTMISQDSPVAGTNHVAVEIIQPAPGEGPNRVGTLIGRGETTLRWVAGDISGPSETVAPRSTAHLTAQMKGPARSTVGEPVAYEIVITNDGSAMAKNVQVVDAFDEGLVHETGDSAVQYTVGDLAPHASRKLDIELRATTAGRLCHQIEVTGDGGLRATAQACTTFGPPRR